MTSSDQGYLLISEEGAEIELKAQGWEKGVVIFTLDPVLFRVPTF